MPSQRTRWVSAAIRLSVRRRTWGDERALTRRSRRMLGGLRLLGRLQASGVRMIPVRDGAVPGEWVVPRYHDQGTVLYLHGGGYVSGSAATHRAVTAGLARRSHRRVFA